MTNRKSFTRTHERGDAPNVYNKQKKPVGIISRVSIPETGYITMQRDTVMTMLCPWGNTYTIIYNINEHAPYDKYWKYVVRTDGMTYTERNISDLPVCHQRNMTTMFNAVEYVDTCTRLEMCETHLHDLQTSIE